MPLEDRKRILEMYIEADLTYACEFCAISKQANKILWDLKDVKDVVLQEYRKSPDASGVWFYRRMQNILWTENSWVISMSWRRLRYKDKLSQASERDSDHIFDHFMSMVLPNVDDETTRSHLPFNVGEVDLAVIPRQDVSHQLCYIRVRLKNIFGVIYPSLHWSSSGSVILTHFNASGGQKVTCDILLLCNCLYKL